MKLIYGGDTPTIHPELGLLEPGPDKGKEIPPAKVAAAARAFAAGLPLSLVDDDGRPVPASVPADLVVPPAEASSEASSADPPKKLKKEKGE